MGQATKTTWRTGETGNRGGRPASMRRALRRALTRVGPPPEPMTRIEQWAEAIIGQAATVADQLAVLAYIDGDRREPRTEP